MEWAVWFRYGVIRARVGRTCCLLHWSGEMVRRRLCRSSRSANAVSCCLYGWSDYAFPSARRKTDFCPTMGYSSFDCGHSRCCSLSWKNFRASPICSSWLFSHGRKEEALPCADAWDADACWSCCSRGRTTLYRTFNSNSHCHVQEEHGSNCTRDLGNRRYFTRLAMNPLSQSSTVRV